MIMLDFSHDLITKQQQVEYQCIICTLVYTLYTLVYITVYTKQ